MPNSTLNFRDAFAGDIPPYKLAFCREFLLRERMLVSESSHVRTHKVERFGHVPESVLDGRRPRSIGLYQNGYNYSKEEILIPPKALAGISCFLLLVSAGAVTLCFISRANYLTTFDAYTEALRSQERLREDAEASKSKEEAANKRAEELEENLKSERLTVSLMLKEGYVPPGAPRNEDEARQQQAATAATVHQNTITTDDGRVYAVSDLEYALLAPQRSSLVLAGRQLDLENAQLTARFNSHNSYQIDESNPYAVDSYNAESNKLNAEKADFDRELDMHNTRISTFNAELARVGTLQAPSTPDKSVSQP